MGSGLILLVIVGAWLAVLVPMALRSHDAATSLRSAERFGDAMRVLSPRSRRTSSSRAGRPGPRRRPRRRERGPSPVEAPPALEPLLFSLRDVEPRPPLTLVERRRRVLLSLLGGAATGLLGGLLTVWLLVLGLLSLGLAVAYVVHLRRLAVARAERSLRAAGSDAAYAGPYGWEVDGVPDRMPARPAPLRVPLPAPAVRYEDPLPQAVGGWQGRTGGGDWSPVPVPLPTYVGKPVAPPRPPRTIDLTQPGRYSEVVTARQLGDEPDLELDDILDGRRAVGGW